MTEPTAAEGRLPSFGVRDKDDPDRLRVLRDLSHAELTAARAVVRCRVHRRRLAVVTPDWHVITFVEHRPHSRHDVELMAGCPECPDNRRVVMHLGQREAVPSVPLSTAKLWVESRDVVCEATTV